MKMTQRLLGAAVILVLWSQSADACLFPWWWWQPPASPGYGAYYGPSYGGSCCSSGGCGVYRPAFSSACSPCGACNPCGCSPCSTGGCATGCGVNYYPEGKAEPEPDPDVNRTFATEGDRGDEGQGAETADPVLPTDDFGPTRRVDPDDPSAGIETDPFTPPTTPMGEKGAGDSDPAPLSPEILGDGVTMNVSPVRTRVLLRAQYGAPQIARRFVAPEAPWVPVRDGARVASK